MKKYFYAKGDEQFGPFTIDELKDKKIERQTLIWFEGLNDWKKASEISELETLFVSMPPPLNSSTPPPLQNSQQVNDTISSKTVKSSPLKKYKNIILIGVIGIFAIVIILVYNYNKRDSSNQNNDYLTSSNELNTEQETESNSSPVIEKSDKELMQELYERECNKRVDFLSGNLSYTPIYKNLLSLKVEGLKLKCSLNNSATLATIGNIKLKIDFISSTGAIITSKYVNVYDFIEPNGSIEYRTEIEISNQEYNDISEFKWKFISAECN